MTPPSMRQLLGESPEFKQYMKTRPRLPEHLTTGNPWMIWAKTVRNTWVNPQYETYDNAWAGAVKLLRNNDFTDVSVISKRVLFAPPKVLLPWLDELLMDNLEWCGRCRRPSSFRRSTAKHHALRAFPTVTEDAPVRCYYCGQRRISNIYSKR